MKKHMFLCSVFKTGRGEKGARFNFRKEFLEVKFNLKHGQCHEICKYFGVLQLFAMNYARFSAKNIENLHKDLLLSCMS